MNGYTPETLGLTILAMSEVPNFMAGLLPSLMTIKRFSADDLDRATLRRGEIVGGSLALATGLGASLIAKSPLPMIGCVAVFIILLHQYESAIRNPHPDATSINKQDKGGGATSYFGMTP